jgi:hypothetical protein
MQLKSWKTRSPSVGSPAMLPIDQHDAPCRSDEALDADVGLTRKQRSADRFFTLARMMIGG